VIRYYVTDDVLHMVIKQLTCREHASKHPALAVLHGVAVVLVVFFQDLDAPAPDRWTGSQRIAAGPVPLHDAAVVGGVDLQRMRNLYYTSQF